MPQILKLAAAQSRTLTTTAETLLALEATSKKAAALNVDLLLFPEAYLGGYPRTCAFGSAVGARTEEGRSQFLHYYRAAVDLGDTPRGAGDDWLDRKLPLPRDQPYRGDGTRETLERIARETGVFLVVGLIERSGGTLYCAALYIDPARGVLGKRRKVQPTGTERLIWGQGSPSTLKAVVAEIRGVRVVMAAAICWENYMPLLRQALYAQNVNLWLAPTADGREAWEGVMRTVGVEGRCWVVSANQCVRWGELPAWVRGEETEETSATKETKQTEGHTVNGEHADGIKPGSPTDSKTRRRSSIITTTPDHHEICWPVPEEKKAPSSTSAKNTSAIDDSPMPPPKEPTTTTTTTTKATQIISPGGSLIATPHGTLAAGPLWNSSSDPQGELLIANVDFDECERGRLDLDVAGSYGRLDAFELRVEGLRLEPPV